jgi:hypothetical protein
MILSEFQKDDIEWKDGGMEVDDYGYLNRECNNESEFDPENKRKRMFMNLTNGKAKLAVGKCEFGSIFAVFEKEEQNLEMPWQIWGRIFRIFSEKASKPFKVFFLANTDLRRFPPNNKAISPENINGGYKSNN